MHGLFFSWCFQFTSSTSSTIVIHSIRTICRPNICVLATHSTTCSCFGWINIPRSKALICHGIPGESSSLAYDVDMIYCTIFFNFHERTHFDTHEQLYAMVLDMDFPWGCFQKPKDGTAGRKCHGTGVAKKSDFGMKTFRSHSEAWGNKSPNQKKLINID